MTSTFVLRATTRSIPWYELSPLRGLLSSRTTLSKRSTTNRLRRFSSSFAEQQEEAYQYEKISFIGAGKMAEALINPLINSKIQPASRISVHDVSTGTMDRMSSMYDGIQTESSLRDCVAGSDLIVCAVKPQNSDVVFKDIKDAKSSGLVDPDSIMLSVMAGKPISSFVSGCGMRRVARSMPNTPAMIGKGVTVWTATENICDLDKERIKTILCSFGKAIYVGDENFIDMATSISGSGPAYIFMLMEAMIDASVHMGFGRDTATTLVHHTLLGSTLYAMETNEHPAVLRNSVTSPAGTTASAMYELENGKFRTVIKDAIWACYRRSLEMGGNDSNIGPGRYTVMAMPPVHEAPSGEFGDDETKNN